MTLFAYSAHWSLDPGTISDSASQRGANMERLDEVWDLLWNDTFTFPRQVGASLLAREQTC